MQRDQFAFPVILCTVEHELGRFLNNCNEFTFNLVIYNKDLWFDLDVYPTAATHGGTFCRLYIVVSWHIFIAGDKICRDEPHFYLLQIFGERNRERGCTVAFYSKQIKLHLILFWRNIFSTPVFIWGWIVTCHAQNVFPDTWSSVFHLNNSSLFDENNPFYGNVALFKNSKRTSRKTVIIERLLSLRRRLTTVQCLKAHLIILIIEFFSKWN